MKEINIHKIIADKRKEKGITQASVSKWETGQSYPDITFLPLLASYFNISIDELISYTPQMEQEDIKNLYHRLAEAFSEEPFDEVMMECREMIKKYYSCFPLLIQMGVLFINHHMLTEDTDKRIEMLEEATKRQREIAYKELKEQKGIKGKLMRLLNVEKRGEKQMEKIKEKMMNTEKDTIKVGFKPMNAKWFREHFQHDIYKDLQQVTCPVLAIAGDKDIQADPERAKRIGDDVKGDSEVYVVPKYGS